MEFVSSVCPHCGKEIQIPRDAERVVCMFCAQPIERKPAAREAEGADYRRLMEEAVSLLNDRIFARKNLKEVKGPSYPALFGEYREAFAPALRAFSMAATENGEAAERFAGVLMDRFHAKFQQEGIRRENDLRLFDWRYLIVAFTIPAIREQKTPAAEELADRFLEKWNARHPKNPLGKATYEEISKGFRRKLCFITTAVCASLGKPDDCAELRRLRAFRDGWMAKTPEGRKKIDEYYLFAPMIVRAIGRSQDPGAVYCGIWEDSIRPCLRMIEAGAPAACAARYEEMVRTLERRWLS